MLGFLCVFNQYLDGFLFLCGSKQWCCFNGLLLFVFLDSISSAVYLCLDSFIFLLHISQLFKNLVKHMIKSSLLFFLLIFGIFLLLGSLFDIFEIFIFEPRFVFGNKLVHSLLNHIVIRWAKIHVEVQISSFCIVNRFLCVAVNRHEILESELFDSWLLVVWLSVSGL